jgi:hypothetical protein
LYIKVMGLGYQRINLCNNNCVLFWKDYEKLDVCLECKESRWQVDRASDEKKKIPWKVMRTFLLHHHYLLLLLMMKICCIGNGGTTGEFVCVSQIILQVIIHLHRLTEKIGQPLIILVSDF